MYRGSSSLFDDSFERFVLRTNQTRPTSKTKKEEEEEADEKGKVQIRN